MTSHHLICLAFWLLSFSGIAGQNDNYPFSIDSEKTPDGHRLVARNAGPAPVSVKVAIINGQYIATDRQFPLYVVVPPGGGTLYLGNVHAAMSGVGYSFQTQYTWTLGDFNASQSPDAIYRLPFRDGSTFPIGQAPGGPITTHHSPDSQFAVDIPMPEGTPVLAAREGTVIYTEANQTYGAQIPDMLSKANEVRIQHIDGTIGIYAHLAHGGVYVYPGQRVNSGQQIGLAGSTGYSSGPHLHFAVQTVRRNGEKLETISLPFSFYVGNPPMVFVPQFGMLAKADYVSPGIIPGSQPTVQVASQALPSPTQARASSPGNSDFVITFEVPPEIRTALLKIRMWQWLTGMLGLLLLYLWFDKRRDAQRREGLRIVREPTFRSRPAEEVIFHGLTAKDKLIIACQGDRLKAERLIEFEYRRAPSINDDEAARRAWEHLQRDRD